MDEFVHGNEHRMAARGNASSFPLPRLQQFIGGAKMKELGRSVSLPRTGQELTHVISVLFKQKHLNKTTLTSTWPVHSSSNGSA